MPASQPVPVETPVAAIAAGRRAPAAPAPLPTASLPWVQLGCDIDPFAATPDPLLFHLTAVASKLLPALTQGLDVPGSVHLLIGESGIGKTTLLVELAARLRAAGERVVCLDAAHRGYRGPRLMRLAGRGKLAVGSGVLLIDAAERLDAASLARLDGLRRASAAAGHRLRILLCGRPELETLARQLSATPVRHHLGRLDEFAACDLILHRLREAGCQDFGPFSAAALRRIARQSGGVPRRIVRLCAARLSTDRDGGGGLDAPDMPSLTGPLSRLRLILWHQLRPVHGRSALVALAASATLLLAWLTPTGEETSGVSQTMQASPAPEPAVAAAPDPAVEVVPAEPPAVADEPEAPVQVPRPQTATEAAPIPAGRPAAAIEPPKEPVRVDSAAAVLPEPAVKAITVPPAEAAGRPLTASELALVLRRGEELLKLGDIAAARLYFQRAADAEDNQGMRALARTYDPGFLRDSHAVGITSDRELADQWYRRAAESPRRGQRPVAD